MMKDKEKAAVMAKDTQVCTTCGRRIYKKTNAANLIRRDIIFASAKRVTA